MTDLTGAELDLAVARVMGRRISTVQPLAGGGAAAGWIDPHKVDAAHCTWRPSHGGAAAWEVLEWVRRRYEAHLTDCDDGHRHCFMHDCMDNSDCASAIGPTDAIALCRAVVALGEAG